MTEPALTRVERACAQLLQAHQQVTFTAVAGLAKVGRATLYRDPQLRASSTSTAPDKPTPAP